MKLIAIKSILNEVEEGAPYVTEEVYEIRQGESFHEFVGRTLPRTGIRPDWHYSDVKFVVKLVR